MPVTLAGNESGGRQNRFTDRPDGFGFRGITKLFGPGQMTAAEQSHQFQRTTLRFLGCLSAEFDQKPCAASGQKPDLLRKTLVASNVGDEVQIHAFESERF